MFSKNVECFRLGVFLWHTSLMRVNATLYIPGDSFVHTCDARVKLVLLLAYSITLFCVNTWTGLGLCLVACVACAVIARLPLKRLLVLLIPLYVILALTLIFNSFSFDVSSAVIYYGIGDVSPGIFGEMQPVVIAGSFGFVPAGFARGCFFALRIILLVLASLVVSLSTTSNALTSAMNSFLRPLEKLKVPTADIAMVVSIALRFIPITADEFMKVRAAQWARGASFSNGSLWKRLSAWQTVFVPLFVALFRRADHLAFAMESRCYGLASKRTELTYRAMTGYAWVAMGVGVVVCVSAAVFL